MVTPKKLTKTNLLLCGIMLSLAPLKMVGMDKENKTPPKSKKSLKNPTATLYPYLKSPINLFNSPQILAESPQNRSVSPAPTAYPAPETPPRYFLMLQEAARLINEQSAMQYQNIIPVTKEPQTSCSSTE